MVPFFHSWWLCVYGAIVTGTFAIYFLFVPILTKRIDRIFSLRKGFVRCRVVVEGGVSFVVFIFLLLFFFLFSFFAVLHPFVSVMRSTKTEIVRSFASEQARAQNAPDSLGMSPIHFDVSRDTSTP